MIVKGKSESNDLNTAKESVVPNGGYCASEIYVI